MCWPNQQHWPWLVEGWVTIAAEEDRYFSFLSFFHAKGAYESHLVFLSLPAQYWLQFTLSQKVKPVKSGYEWCACLII